jgi:hypothetical protein
MQRVWEIGWIDAAELRLFYCVVGLEFHPTQFILKIFLRNAQSVFTYLDYSCF